MTNSFRPALMASFLSAWRSLANVADGLHLPVGDRLHACIRLQERMEVNAGGLYDRKATRGKWGGLSATLVVVGSIQSPHSSALMTYDDNDEQNRLLDQSLGELCRRDNWSSLQSVLSENAVVAKHGLAKGGRKEDVGSRYFQHRYRCSTDGTATQSTDTLSNSIDKSATLVPLAKRVASAIRRNWRGAQAGILAVDMLNALGNGVKEVRS